MISFIILQRNPCKTLQAPAICFIVGILGKRMYKSSRWVLATPSLILYENTLPFTYRQLFKFLFRIFFDNFKNFFDSSVQWCRLLLVVVIIFVVVVVVVGLKCCLYYSCSCCCCQKAYNFVNFPKKGEKKETFFQNRYAYVKQVIYVLKATERDQYIVCV